MNGGRECCSLRTTYQHSINHILDEMDLIALEKHAVKDNADIARIIKRANEGDLNDEQDFALNLRGNPPGPRSKDKDGKPVMASMTRMNLGAQIPSTCSESSAEKWFRSHWRGCGHVRFQPTEPDIHRISRTFAP